MTKDNELAKHNAEEISKIYDILISLIKRVEKLEKHTSILVTKLFQIPSSTKLDNEEDDGLNEWGHDLDKDREYLERKKEKEEEEKK